MAIEDKLKALDAPTLIVWGTDDVYFDVKWSHWFARTIPGTRRRIEIEGGRIFFPEERWRELNAALRAHWEEAAPALCGNPQKGSSPSGRGQVRE